MMCRVRTNDIFLSLHLEPNLLDMSSVLRPLLYGTGCSVNYNTRLCQVVPILSSVVHLFRQTRNPNLT